MPSAEDVGIAAGIVGLIAIAMGWLSNITNAGKGLFSLGIGFGTSIDAVLSGLGFGIQNLGAGITSAISNFFSLFKLAPWRNYAPWTVLPPTAPSQPSGQPFNGYLDMLNMFQNPFDTGTQNSIGTPSGSSGGYQMLQGLSESNPSGKAVLI